MSDVQLKPCPFCGSTRIKFDLFIRDGKKVECMDCWGGIYAFEPNANQKSIAAWNRRMEGGGHA